MVTLHGFASYFGIPCLRIRKTLACTRCRSILEFRDCNRTGRSLRRKRRIEIRSDCIRKVDIRRECFRIRPVQNLKDVVLPQKEF